MDGWVQPCTFAASCCQTRAFSTCGVIYLWGEYVQRIQFRLASAASMGVELRGAPCLERYACGMKETVLTKRFQRRLSASQLQPQESAQEPAGHEGARR